VNPKAHVGKLGLTHEALRTRILLKFALLHFKDMFALKEKYLPKYTKADYLQWEGNWELISGVPYAMSPMHSWRHQKLNVRIVVQIEEALKGCPECDVNMPINWEISKDTIVQPDVVVICKPFEEGIFIEKTPEIVFEILSPATSKKDQTLKYELYQDAGVKYYVIVNPSSKKAEIFILDNQNTKRYRSEGTFDSGKYHFEVSGCGFEFDFGKMW